MTRPRQDRHVLHVAAEMSPHASTGGLGEVVGSLPAALQSQGWRSTVLLPCYGHLQDVPPATTCVWSGEVEAGRTFDVRVLEARTSEGPRLWLLECEELFARAGVYGTAQGLFADNDTRFAVLSRVAVRLAAEYAPRFALLHAHDWHAALAVAYAQGLDPAVATVLTIHNYAYRGDFAPARLRELGLSCADPSLASFLECGIESADAVTTVSPQYAREIESGGGVFARRADSLRGILNGLDLSQWDPTTDPRLVSTFDATSLERRAANRRALESELGWDHEDGALAAFQGRFAFQKGLDVLLDAAPRLVDRGLRLIVHGDGDGDLERRVRELAVAHPRRVAARIGFDRDFSARLFAGIDLLIMPSRFEPCGLSHLQAMRYGAIPLVHATGGLRDTIHPLGGRGHRGAASNGFWMKTLTPRALSLAVGKALRYLAQSHSWRTLQRNAMEQDVSWTRSAAEYATLYEETLERARSRPPRTTAVDADVDDAAEVVEPQAGVALEGPELPDRYHQPMLHLVAQAPRMLYAYWELPGARSVCLCLDDEGRRREVAVVQSRGEAWIPVRPGRPYAVGIEDGQGRELLRSGRIHAPPEKLLDEVPPRPGEVPSARATGPHHPAPSRPGYPPEGADP